MKLHPHHCAGVVRYTLRQSVQYLLRLGTTGFGGPVALVGYTLRDLVEQRGWITVHLNGKHTCIAVVLSLVLSVALHAVVLALANNYQFNKPDAPKAGEKIVYLEVVSPRSEKQLPEPVIPSTAKAPKAVPAIQALQDELIATPATEERQTASMAAPSAPTAQEWAFAAKYTNKNSKGYRYHWGQQVRSMMGTAVAGKDQGVVRFRLEIAPVDCV